MAQPLDTLLALVAEDGEGERTGGDSGNPPRVDRGAWMGDMLSGMRQRTEERREGRQRGHNPPPGGGADDLSLQHHGSIGKLDMPRGFRRNTVLAQDSPINTSVHSPDSYRAYSLGRDADTKICYWKLDAHSPGEQSAAAMQKLLTPGPNNPPHKLSQDEIDAISEAIPSALYGYNGNFEVLQLLTTDINGKRVLMMETKYRDVDRSTIGIFANPDPKTSSIEMVWFEANKAQYRAHAGDAWRAIQSLKWEGQQQQPQQQQQQLQQLPPQQQQSHPRGLFRRR